MNDLDVGVSISQLKQWVKDELVDIRFNTFENTVKILVDEGESNPEKSAYEYKFKFNIYTETNCYRISAIERNEDSGYLGCTASARKARTGEGWIRGNDLADGKLTRGTWERIVSDIVAYELVKLAPKVTSGVEETVEAVKKR